MLPLKSPQSQSKHNLICFFNFFRHFSSKIPQIHQFLLRKLKKKKMESLDFHNIKLEKANAIPRYKKHQKVTVLLFRFIEFCVFCFLISRFSTELPLTFKLSTDYFKGLGFTLISPPFVFVLGNAIVIILFLKSGHSSAKDGSMNSVKIDLYDEYKQKCSMNKEAYYEQSKKQKKQSILVRRQLVEKRIHRSHSDSFTSLSHDENPRKELIRSATVGCLKVIHTDDGKSEMSSEECRKTVEAFIARQQRFLREEELFST
ncbi:hypothetical protein HAX54_035212 [Datura stramonium]|uniref:DUF4408 domain-containing protein n=1 Tax=Datura stramonium TaxID=4076 RepID=A0ABS8SF16_DATST|nr:hypothetical protein [Datura stramonium]